MLPSSINVSNDTHVRGVPGGLQQHGTARTAAYTRQQLLARGPLARTANRLLGAGGADQAWSAWAQRPLDVAFGGAASRGLQLAWLGARTLPTPNGYFRATSGPTWAA